MSLDFIVDSVRKPDSLESVAGNTLTGLHNLGNTCYLNSVLQILFHTPELKEFFFSAAAGEVIKSNRGYQNIILVAKFYELFVSYWTKDIETATRDLAFFKQVLGRHFAEFDGGRQNDQHECITYLFDVLHQGLSSGHRFRITAPLKPDDLEPDLDILEKKALEQYCSEGLSGYEIPVPKGVIYISPISNNFTGQRHTRTECVNCGYISHHFDVFRVLELQIPNKVDITLDDCLVYNTGITQLGKDDQYRCDRCKQLNCSRRRTTLWRLPKILSIVLVRNLVTMKNGQFFNIKDPRKVEFPEHLDLAKYTSNFFNKTTYQLDSIACHHGVPCGGHCISYLKTNTPESEWSVFDDQSVSPLEKARLVGPEAYILFYRAV